MGRSMAGTTAISKHQDDEVAGWVLLNASYKISSGRPDVSVAFYVLPTPLTTTRSAS
jgi:hypothetical protein